MRALIIHGLGGSPSENWFPWLKAELERRGIAVVVPQFPSPQGQSPRAWFEVLARERIELSSDDIIVAHSLGPLFALHLLEHTRVRAAFFVAPFTRRIGIEGIDAVNAPFFKKFEFAAIKKNLSASFVYASDNDPFVAQDLSREFAHDIGSTFILVPGAGHFNQGGGMYAFPRLLADIDALLS